MDGDWVAVVVKSFICANPATGEAKRSVPMIGYLGPSRKSGL